MVGYVLQRIAVVGLGGEEDANLVGRADQLSGFMFDSESDMLRVAVDIQVRPARSAQVTWITWLKFGREFDQKSGSALEMNQHTADAIGPSHVFLTGSTASTVPAKCCSE